MLKVPLNTNQPTKFVPSLILSSHSLTDSSDNGNVRHRTPAGMETNIAALPWGFERNAEMKTHFTMKLLLLCLQWKKRICQQLLLNLNPMTMWNNTPAAILRNYQWYVFSK